MKVSAVVKILNEQAKATKYFSNSKYKDRVKKASSYCNDQKFTEAMKILESLPTEGELLKELVSKLKGKSVYKTLRKIEEGKIEKGPQFLKGLFSLGTHVAIEVDHGNREYSILYPVIYEKLGEILYTD